MDRVQVTRPFVVICHMQVCAVKDATDFAISFASWTSGERKFWVRATARTRLERGMVRRCTSIMKVEHALGRQSLQRGRAHAGLEEYCAPAGTALGYPCRGSPDRPQVPGQEENGVRRPGNPYWVTLAKRRGMAVQMRHSLLRGQRAVIQIATSN